MKVGKGDAAARPPWLVLLSDREVLWGRFATAEAADERVVAEVEQQEVTT